MEAEVPWEPFSTSSALEVMALLEALVAQAGAGERWPGVALECAGRKAAGDCWT